MGRTMTNPKKVGLTILKEYIEQIYSSDSYKAPMDYLKTKTSEQISDTVCKMGILKIYLMN